MNLDSPQTRYAMLRTALEMFQVPPADLDATQSVQLQQQVSNQLAISKRLLEGGDASQVVIPDNAVDQAFNSLLSQYEDDEDFDKTLAYNQLDRDSLREALRYELRVETVLEQFLSEHATVSDDEVEIYYLQHRERFTLPETRTVYHILITINDDYAENSPAQAKKRMDELLKKCGGDGGRLKQLAQRHSECPSSMNDGLIGRVKPGQLYPQLDAKLFAMDEGELSEVVESEIGLHILYCEKVHGVEHLALDKVKEKVRELLENKKRSSALKQRLQG